MLADAVMFTADDIQTRVRSRPFVPLRIVTSAGESHDVYHPDLVLIGRSFLIVGIPSAQNASLAELVTRVPILHIAELRDLPLPQVPERGGDGRG